MSEENRLSASPPAFPRAAHLHAWFLQHPHPAQAIDEAAWRAWALRATQRLGKDRTIHSLALALGLTWPRTRAEQVLADFATITLRQLEQSHGLGRMEIATLLTSVAFASGAYGTGEHSANAFPSETEAALGLSDRLLASLFESLQPREADVVMRRFGLGGYERATLDSVGQDKAFQVSRERIRQIETTALGKLRLSPHYEMLRRTLHNDAETIWAELTQDAPVLRASQLSEAESHLAPVRSLAIALVHRKLSRWIEQHATRLVSGWYLAPLPVAVVRSLSTRLLKVLRHRNQPVLFSRLCRSLESEPTAVHVAIECNPRISNILGYVYEGSRTRRRRRRARVHRLLAQRHRLECTPGFVIAGLYTGAFPDDRCSIRDLETVMRDSPHLFLRCAEEGWIALSSHTSPPFEAIPRWLVHEDSEAPAEEDEGARQQGSSNTSGATLSEFLRSTLLREGPLHISKILALCLAHFGSRHPVSSIPAVITQGNYVRLAPGVWGLPHHVSLLSDNTTHSSPVLLSEADCRMYTRSRHAGELATIYPMWTPAMEYHWATWAQHNASPELFSSFLFVADPTTWPVPNEVQRQWQDIKNERGQYRLRDPLKYHLAESLPPLKNLLRIAATAYARGHISWISANRLVGRRIDSHRSATSLAILIELRVVESAGHWQERHAATSACANFVDRLVDELHETGLLEWDSDVGHEVSTLVARSGQTPHHTWAPEPELLALRAALETPSTTLADHPDGDFSDLLDGNSRLDEGATTLNPDIQRFLDEP